LAIPCTSELPALPHRSRKVSTTCTNDSGALQSIDIGGDLGSPVAQYLQRWLLEVLVNSKKLVSLQMYAGEIPWPPVLGHIALREIELTMIWDRPWMETFMQDLSFCACIESLKITDTDELGTDQHLPRMTLHAVTSLKHVQLIGWWPQHRASLPRDCLLQLAMDCSDVSEWDDWQELQCPTSMLFLDCQKMQTWPTEIEYVSGLQWLEFNCKRLLQQDLAVLQCIPHVRVGLKRYSTLLLTDGTWQSIEIKGEKGFEITFSDVDSFVKGTEKFLFICPSKQSARMYNHMHAACRRQGVACHVCEHAEERNTDDNLISVARLSNTKLCKGLAQGLRWWWNRHETLMDMEMGYWPKRSVYPELYM